MSTQFKAGTYSYITVSSSSSPQIDSHFRYSIHPSIYQHKLSLNKSSTTTSAMAAIAIAANAQKNAHQLLCLVAARATKDPDTSIRVFSPEFTRVTSLLTTRRTQRMRDPSEIIDFGLPGTFLLYPERQIIIIMCAMYKDICDSKALAAFARDCWAIYSPNNDFRVSRLGNLSALLGWQCGGVGVMKQWLKRIHIKISVTELRRVEKETGDSVSRWVSERLDELLECASLERVTIELKDDCRRSASPEMMVDAYNKAVLPVVEDLRLRVQDVQIKCPRSWEPIRSFAEVFTSTDSAILRTSRLWG